MDCEWDGDKWQRNLTKHGIDFTAIAGFEWGSAIMRLDLRGQYGELRFRAYGLINGRLHILIFTARGPRARLISLRKASLKEKASYETTP